MLHWADILTTGSAHSCKNVIKRILRSSNFRREFLKYPTFWVFGPTLTPIYLLKMAKIKNSHRVIQINQNQGPISFQFSMKTIVAFSSIWAFFGYKWAQYHPLLKPRCWWSNFGRSSFSTRVFPALVLFFILPDNFFNFGLF